MMILLALGAATAATPLVVDVAGMPPQIRLLRAEASKNGWAISCEGRSGEERVLRLVASDPRARQSLDSYFRDPDALGSTSQVYGARGPVPASCDLDPPLTSSDRPATQLSYGEPQLLNRLLPLAVDCGFQRAFIRPLLNTDPGYDKLSTRKGFQILDAGEDIVPRDGPMICVLQMIGRILPKQEISRLEGRVQRP